MKTENRRHIRHKRVRGKISVSSQRLRFCVFRSGRHIYGQIIDDGKGKTLVAASDKEIKAAKSSVLTKKAALAFEAGKMIAKKALEKKIEKVVFDRGGYKYHGRVKALADGAREGGLKF